MSKLICVKQEARSKTFLIFIMLLIASSLSITSAQDRTEFNPDGSNVSFHFTPYLTDIGILYDGDEFNADQGFNFNFEIKIPLSVEFTASFFYNYESTKISLPSYQNFFNISRQSYGATFSFYLQ